MQPGQSPIPVILIFVAVFSQVYIVLGIEAQVNCTATRNGGNVDLMCKVPSHLDITQVSWHRSTENSYESLMTQSKRFGLNISKPYENHLSVLQTNDPGTSAITLSQMQKEEDACFVAIFNSYPHGALKGEVCLTNIGAEAQVQCNVTRNGGRADLTCKVPSDKDIVLVTWKKRKGNSYETLMTQSKRFKVNISKPYENRLSVLATTDPGTSAIVLSQMEKEDDACFIAIFNLFPDGALKGEVCLPKLHEVREVICKSPADFSVTLEPPQIVNQHSEPNGNIIQKGRWLDANISPVCSFQLQKKARTRRNVQGGDKIFTIECTASGTQRPTITWIKEGQPLRREETVNITGDLITVTSTRRHSLSTLPKEEVISCNISYDKDNGFSIEQGEDSHYKKRQRSTFVRILVLSLAVLISVVLLITVFKMKKPEHKAKEDPPSTSDNGETPGTTNTPSDVVYENENWNGRSDIRQRWNAQANTREGEYFFISSAVHLKPRTHRS